MKMLNEPQPSESYSRPLPLAYYNYSGPASSLSQPVKMDSLPSLGSTQLSQPGTRGAKLSSVDKRIEPSRSSLNSSIKGPIVQTRGNLPSYMTATASWQGKKREYPGPSVKSSLSKSRADRPFENLMAKPRPVTANRVPSSGSLSIAPSRRPMTSYDSRIASAAKVHEDPLPPLTTSLSPVTTLTRGAGTTIKATLQGLNSEPTEADIALLSSAIASSAYSQPGFRNAEMKSKALATPTFHNSNEPDSNGIPSVYPPDGRSYRLPTRDTFDPNSGPEDDVDTFNGIGGPVVLAAGDAVSSVQNPVENAVAPAADRQRQTPVSTPRLANDASFSLSSFLVPHSGVDATVAVNDVPNMQGTPSAHKPQSLRPQPAASEGAAKAEVSAASDEREFGGNLQHTSSHILDSHKSRYAHHQEIPDDDVEKADSDIDLDSVKADSVVDAETQEKEKEKEKERAKTEELEREKEREGEKERATEELKEREMEREREKERLSTPSIPSLPVPLPEPAISPQPSLRLSSSPQVATPRYGNPGSPPLDQSVTRGTVGAAGTLIPTPQQSLPPPLGAPNTDSLPQVSYSAIGNVTVSQGVPPGSFATPQPNSSPAAATATSSRYDSPYIPQSQYMQLDPVKKKKKGFNGLMSKVAKVFKSSTPVVPSRIPSPPSSRMLVSTNQSYSGYNPTSQPPPAGYDQTGSLIPNSPQHTGGDYSSRDAPAYGAQPATLANRESDSPSGQLPFGMVAVPASSQPTLSQPPAPVVPSPLPSVAPPLISSNDPSLIDPPAPVAAAAAAATVPPTGASVTAAPAPIVPATPLSSVAVSPPQPDHLPALGSPVFSESLRGQSFKQRESAPDNTKSSYDLTAPEADVSQYDRSSDAKSETKVNAGTVEETAVKEGVSASEARAPPEPQNDAPLAVDQSKDFIHRKSSINMPIPEALVIPTVSSPLSPSTNGLQDPPLSRSLSPKLHRRARDASAQDDGGGAPVASSKGGAAGEDASVSVPLPRSQSPTSRDSHGKRSTRHRRGADSRTAKDGLHPQTTFLLPFVVPMAIGPGADGVAGLALRESFISRAAATGTLTERLRENISQSLTQMLVKSKLVQPLDFSAVFKQNSSMPSESEEDFFTVSHHVRHSGSPNVASPRSASPRTPTLGDAVPATGSVTTSGRAPDPASPSVEEEEDEAEMEAETEVNALTAAAAMASGHSSTTPPCRPPLLDTPLEEAYDEEEEGEREEEGEEEGEEEQEDRFDEEALQTQSRGLAPNPAAEVSSFFPSGLPAPSPRHDGSGGEWIDGAAPPSQSIDKPLCLATSPRIHSAAPAAPSQLFPTPSSPPSMAGASSSAYVPAYAKATSSSRAKINPTIAPPRISSSLSVSATTSAAMARRLGRTSDVTPGTRVPGIAQSVASMNMSVTSFGTRTALAPRMANASYSGFPVMAPLRASGAVPSERSFATTTRPRGPSFMAPTQASKGKLRTADAPVPAQSISPRGLGISQSIGHGSIPGLRPNVGASFSSPSGAGLVARPDFSTSAKLKPTTATATPVKTKIATSASVPPSAAVATTAASRAVITSKSVAATPETSAGGSATPGRIAMTTPHRTAVHSTSTAKQGVVASPSLTPVSRIPTAASTRSGIPSSPLTGRKAAATAATAATTTKAASGQVVAPSGSLATASNPHSSLNHSANNPSLLGNTTPGKGSAAGNPSACAGNGVSAAPATSSVSVSNLYQKGPSSSLKGVFLAVPSSPAPRNGVSPNARTPSRIAAANGGSAAHQSSRPSAIGAASPSAKRIDSSDGLERSPRSGAGVVSAAVGGGSSSLAPSADASVAPVTPLTVAALKRLNDATNGRNKTMDDDLFVNFFSASASASAHPVVDSPSVSGMVIDPSGAFHDDHQSPLHVEGNGEGPTQFFDAVFNTEHSIEEFVEVENASNLAAAAEAAAAAVVGGLEEQSHSVPEILSQTLPHAPPQPLIAGNTTNNNNNNNNNGSTALSSLLSGRSSVGPYSMVGEEENAHMTEEERLEMRQRQRQRLMERKEKLMKQQIVAASAAPTAPALGDPTSMLMSGISASSPVAAANNNASVFQTRGNSLNSAVVASPFPSLLSPSSSEQQQILQTPLLSSPLPMAGSAFGGATTSDGGAMAAYGSSDIVSVDGDGYPTVKMVRCSQDRRQPRPDVEIHSINSATFNTTSTAPVASLQSPAKSTAATARGLQPVSPSSLHPNALGNALVNGGGNKGSGAQGAVDGRDLVSSSSNSLSVNE